MLRKHWKNQNSANHKFNLDPLINTPDRKQVSIDFFLVEPLVRHSLCSYSSSRLNGALASIGRVDSELIDAAYQAIARISTANLNAANGNETRSTKKYSNYWTNYSNLAERLLSHACLLCTFFCLISPPCSLRQWSIVFLFSSYSINN